MTDERARELACVGGCIPRYVRQGKHNPACDRRTKRFAAALREYGDEREREALQDVFDRMGYEAYEEACDYVGSRLAALAAEKEKP